MLRTSYYDFDKALDIYSEMKRKNISTYFLADRFNCSQALISKVLRGTRQNRELYNSIKSFVRSSQIRRRQRKAA
jgi:hypothetical protein